MGNDKFILERKTVPNCNSGGFHTVRLKDGVYNILVSMALESGQSLAKVTSAAVHFAADRLVYVDTCLPEDDQEEDTEDE